MVVKLDQFRRTIRNRIGKKSSPHKDTTVDVHYVGCPNGDRLMCAIESLKPSEATLVITLAEGLSYEYSPVEVRGKYVRFEVDLNEIDAEDGLCEAKLSIALANSSYPLSAPVKDRILDGPVKFDPVWWAVEVRNGLACLVRHRRANEIVIARGIASTANGVCVTLPPDVESVEVQGPNGANARVSVVSGKAELDLTELPVRGETGPHYWRLFAVREKGVLPVVVGSRDLVDASSAYFLPSLTFKSSDGSYYYAKPYAAKGSSQVSVRTGEWVRSL